MDRLVRFTTLAVLTCALDAVLPSTGMAGVLDLSTTSLDYGVSLVGQTSPRAFI